MGKKEGKGEKGSDRAMKENNPQPGAKTLLLTPCGPKKNAKLFIKCVSAALLVLYPNPLIGFLLKACAEPVAIT